MVSYHHVKSEKTNNPILRKLSDGRDRQTDGQTYRQTDGRTDERTDRWTRVISKDAVRLTSSVQNTHSESSATLQVGV